MTKKRFLLIDLPVLLTLIFLGWLMLRSVPDSGEGPEESAPPVLDLVEALPAADFVADTPHFVFGSEQGKHHYQEVDLRYHSGCAGWYSLRDEENNKELALLLGGRGEFRMTVLNPGPSVLELQGGAVEGGENDPAELRVYLSDRFIGKGHLPRGREPVAARFPIAEGMLEAGDNYFRVEVEGGVEGDLPLPAFPVIISAFMVSARLEDVSAPDPPRPIAIPRQGPDGKPALIQASGSLLHYYYNPEAGERLQGSVRVKTKPLKVAVRVTSADGEEKELFSRVLTPDQGSVDLDLDLSVFPGKVCRLTLQSGVAGASKAGVYARWEAPAIYKRDSIPARGEDADTAAGTTAPSIADKPNILVILLDAASTFFFESLAGSPGATPAADALAEDSVIFTQAVVPAPYTLPSVGSLMTGRLPDRHGVLWHASRDGRNVKLAGEVDTLASVLKQAGYATCAVVTNPNAAGLYGYDRGFDRYEELFKNPDLWSEGVEPEPALESAKTFIRQAQAQDRGPFFLYVHLFQPHAPYKPPADYVSRFAKPYEGVVDGGRASIDGFKDLGVPALGPEDFAHLKNLYRANLAFVDDAVGRFIAWLREEGLYDESLIVLCSDHGEAFGEHRSIEHGHHLYEEALRVPLLIKFHDGRFKGKRIEETVGLIDVAPTLAASGGGNPKGLSVDGMDLALLFEDAAACSDRVFIARSDVFKPSFSCRWQDFQFIYDSLNRRSELYRVAEDPRQEKNLIKQECVIAGFLRMRLFSRLEELFEKEQGETIDVTQEFIESVQGLGYTGGRGESPQETGDPWALPIGRR
ncbi:MAG: sulfatase family protein [Planctomycetota bacterium]|jgi:arylsulfatase A-like enzyme